MRRVGLVQIGILGSADRIFYLILAIGWLKSPNFLRKPMVFEDCGVDFSRPVRLHNSVLGIHVPRAPKSNKGMYT